MQSKNISEIEGLNQRGGPTLSIVDLVNAKTVSTELIAHCWTAIAHGASFLTAAQPSGAGKSTVLANLLCLLPPDEEIVTFTDRTVVDDNVDNCYLAHEIGSGHWYGYIWGRKVAQFFRLMADDNRIASCIHADYLDETRQILTSSPLNVAPDHFAMLELILFVHRARDGRRRVASAYESTGDAHRLAFEWDEAGDSINRQGQSALFQRIGATEDEYQRKLSAVKDIVKDGRTQFQPVRDKVLQHYHREG